MGKFILTFFICLCFVKEAFCADITSLYGTISLNAGEQKVDTTISQKSSQGYQQTNFASFGTFILNGNTNASYTLNADNNVTSFTMDGLQLNANAVLNLNNYHTWVFDYNSKGVLLQQNALLNVNMSYQGIISSGTDWGGASKIRFNANTPLTLMENSTANFTNMQMFIHAGNITLSQGSKLDIQSQITRIQGSLVNNGGSITITPQAAGNSKGFYNIGNDQNNTGTKVSTIQNNSGNMVINTDFYNGGQAFIDPTCGSSVLNVCDPGFGGGGNLIVNGGEVTINGKLVSMRGGDLVAGGDMINTKDSMIGIYGGVLNVTGGLTNDVGSTLIFGTRNGNMGVLNGNLDSKNGNVLIDVAGASEGTFKLINGTISGITQGQNLSIINGNNEFGTAIFNPATFELTINMNKQEINNFINSLDSNNKAILNAINKKYNNIFISKDSNELRNITHNILNGIYSEYISTPFSILDSIKLAQVLESKRQNINSIAGWYLSTNALGLGVIGSNIGIGGAGGINIGLHKIVTSHTLSFQLGYAFGSVKFEDSNTFNSSNNVAFSIIDNIIFGYNRKFELDVGLYYFRSFMNVNRELNGIDSNVNNIRSSANASLMQVVLDSSIGYKFNIANFSIKPFVGFSNVINFWGRFSETSSSNAILASMNTQSIYNLNVVTGLQNSYYLSNFISLLFSFGYDNLLCVSDKIAINVENNMLYFNMPYKHRIYFDFGANFSINDFMSAGANMFYKATFGGNGLDSSSANYSTFSNYFGVNASFSYRF